MTEKEWLKCADPTPMLKFLRGQASDRKARLFLAACCRDSWPWLPDVRSQNAVAISERFADGMATKEELLSARVEARGRGSHFGPHLAVLAASLDVGWAITSRNNRQPSLFQWQYWWRGTSKLQASILREIFGNPFRPISVNPNWLTPTVSNLATSAYEERAMPSGELDTASLAILADALEETGCDNQELLSHLRSPRPHVRGCFAVDLLLGKE